MMRSTVTLHSALKFFPHSERGWKKSILRLIGTLCQSLAEFQPRVYLLLAVTSALLGYLYLLFFPTLAFISSIRIYEELFSSQTLAWSRLFFWLALAAVSSLVSYHLIRFRPAAPAGRLLDRDAAPSLEQLVADQARHYGARVDRIILSGKFEIDMVKTPRFALPVWSLNTLVIGLPLIQSLSESRFQCMLARRLGQSSKRHNRLENWLYQLRTIWPQYCRRTRENAYGYQPIRWFFRCYVPFYKVITLPAAHLDELAADNYAMELFNEEEVLDAIASQTICHKYLTDCYWPAMRKIAASGKKPASDLQSAMPSVLCNILQGDKVAHWLEKTLSAETRWNDVRPSLVKRLENIGHSQARMRTSASVPAASTYLGPAFDKPGSSRTCSGQRILSPDPL